LLSTFAHLLPPEDLAYNKDHIALIVGGAWESRKLNGKVLDEQFKEKNRFLLEFDR